MLNVNLYGENLTEEAIKLIVEKLILALFYNNKRLKGAFDCFDLDSDGSISKNEFFYGINSLELGKSLYNSMHLRPNKF